MKGFTLFELLISLAISSILLSIAVPGFGMYIQKSQADVAVSEVFTAFLFARNYAVTQVEDVQLCGSDDGFHCQQQWSQQMIAFIDRNDNKQAEPAEIIRYFQLELGNASMRSRMAFGRASTTFKPNGQASLTGSMIYCPHNREAKNVKRVTWNRVGRAYKGIDTNGDGIVEDTNGGNLLAACP